MSEWQFYQDALAGKKPEAREGDIHTGYYRTKRYDPVAFWFHQGKPVCLRSGKPVANPDDMADLFLQVSRFPIEYALYNDVVAGKPWPHEAVAMAVAEPEVVPAPDAFPDPDAGEFPIGHNQPPDEFVLFKEEVERWTRVKIAKEDAPAPKDQVESDAYANVSKELQSLENKANSLYDALRKPIAEQLAILQKRWLPLINDIETRKKRIKKLIGTWQKAETDRRNALAAAAPGTVAEKVKSGTTGTVALRSWRSAKIVDYAVALDHFKDHPDIVEIVQRLANNLANNQIAAPGCEIVTHKEAA